jgi:hypothetical protein
MRPHSVMPARSVIRGVPRICGPAAQSESITEIPACAGMTGVPEVVG